MLGWKAEDIIGKMINELPLEDAKGSIIPPSSRPANVAMATG
jgi:hypothetical protein